MFVDIIVFMFMFVSVCLTRQTYLFFLSHNQMSESKVIVADDGTKVYPINTTEDIISIFLNKNTALYGLTGSGKSYVSNTILAALQEVIPKFLCYSATENLNHNYSKIAPATTVFEHFDIDKLKSDFGYQEKFFGNFLNANNIEFLKALFEKYAPPEDKTEMNGYLRRLEELKTDDKAIKKVEMATISLYKKYVCKYKLSKQEEKSKEWMYVNPLLCIILDDFAAELESACKNKSSGGQEFMRSWAYNGRHYGITSLVMLQDINVLETKVRKNVHNNIFTSMQEARAFAGNKTNSLSADQVRKINSITQKLDELGGHRVLIVSRESEHHYYYMIGSNVVPKLCSDVIYSLDGQIAKEKKDEEVTFSEV